MKKKLHSLIVPVISYLDDGNAVSVEHLGKLVRILKERGISRLEKMPTYTPIGSFSMEFTAKYDPEKQF